MKLVVLLGAVAALAVPSMAAAQYYQPYGGYKPPKNTYQYDYRSGNSYSTTTRSDGSSTYYGFNGRTGSTWSGSTDRQGNARGFDSNGNAWSYNRSTGTYMNYGTGKMCTGTGYGRICN